MECPHKTGKLVNGKVECAACGMSLARIGASHAKTVRGKTARARARAPSRKAPSAPPTSIRIASGMIRIDGMHLVTESNAGGDWRPKAMRARSQRERVTVALLGAATMRLEPPALVVITRRAPLPLDDDNLTGSAKHVRDAIATWIGVDDRHKKLVRYVVEEATGPDAVLIEMRPEASP